MKQLNYELLKELYCIFSPSNGEKRMRRFVKRYIKDNIPLAVVVQDPVGNLYVTKGISNNYPCLCAHMDQVQHIHPKDFVCIESSDVIFGYSPKLRSQCGLGADDKNGIFIALTCLESFDILKCAFFVGEEIGCVGSSDADATFFSDCRYCIQIDRRGNSDIVTSISLTPICSDDFILDTDCTSYGYNVSEGMLTDVYALRNSGITASCINLSCGYYEPHTDYEISVKSDIEKCYNFVCHIIEDCTKTYTFIPQEHVLSSRSRYTDYDYYNCVDWCIDLLTNGCDFSKSEIVRILSDYYDKLPLKDIERAYDEAKLYID